jgi:Protein of unknown function (DUF2971)
LPKFRDALENGLERLFHYQSYKRENLENTIRQRVIRFSRASGFNDPWDCKPSFFVPEDRRELERLVRYMQAASEKHTPEMASDEREARVKHYLDHPCELRSDLANASAEMWAQMDRRYRIYCLSARPDSQLMWGHYADHHRGVCLEFDVRTPDFSLAIQVDYNASYPNFSLADDNDLSPFHTKSSDWAYEQEYRLIAQEESEALRPGTLMTHDGFFQFSECALVSVIIGASASDDTRREVSELARGSGLLVRTATRVPHRYELTFDPSF